MPVCQRHFADVLHKGYEIGEEEVKISLDGFRRNYADPSGAPESVFQPRTLSTARKHCQTDTPPSRKKMNTSFRPTDAMLTKYTAIPTKAEPNPQPQIGTIWIEFSSDAGIGIKQMRAFAQHVSQHKFYTGILVTQASITPAALKIIPVVLPSIIETFQEQDLLVNITHHELVPTHELLSAEQKVELLKRYRLKESQLPRIQVGDPVAKYLGLRKGQVVKIIRRSETAGRYASYRWAI